MPTVRHVSAHVMSDNAVLEEWGARSYEGGASCFIEAVTGKSFEVKLRPTTLPFAGYGEYDDEPNWHLLVTFHLDGCETFEKREILFVEDNRFSFTPPHGEIFMEGRYIKTADGKVLRCTWQFSETGAERTLEGPHIAGDGEAEDHPVPLTVEDKLQTPVRSPTVNSLENDEPTIGHGHIKLILDRVHILFAETKAYNDPEGADTASGPAARDASDVKNITHTITRVVDEELVGGKTDFTRCDFIDKLDDHYATFDFYYCEDSMLRKFGFAGHPSATTTGHGITQHSSALPPTVPPASVHFTSGNVRLHNTADSGSERSFRTTEETPSIRKPIPSDTNMASSDGTSWLDLRGSSPSFFFTDDDHGIGEGSSGTKRPLLLEHQSSQPARTLNFLSGSNFKKCRCERNEDTVLNQDNAVKDEAESAEEEDSKVTEEEDEVH